MIRQLISMKLISAALMLFAVTPAAEACFFAQSQVFTPTLKDWEMHPGPAQKHEGAAGEYWEGVPAPVVRVLKVTRGTAAPGMSCDDAGTIELEVTLPATSTYDIREFGVYLRVTSGKLPDAIFPMNPLVGEIDNGKMRLFRVWLDGHPRQQFPLDLEVEAFLVTNDLSIGPSTRFRVTAPVAK